MLTLHEIDRQDNTAGIRFLGKAERSHQQRGSRGGRGAGWRSRVTKRVSFALIKTEL